MHDVFISYSTKNYAIADAICHQLEAGGVRCWYAPRDVQPGTGWAGQIMRAIEEAPVFLLIYSEAYNQSAQVLNELTAAVDAKCTIVPFRVDASDMSDDLAYYLKRIHWLDALNPPTEQQLDNLYQHICAILHRAPGSQTAPEQPAIEKPKAKRRKLLPGLAIAAGAVLALVILLLAVSAMFSGETVQEIHFMNLSDLQTHKYPFYSGTMFSAEADMFAVQDRDDGTLTIARTDDGNQYRTGIDFVFEDPLNADIAMATGYDTVYFIDYSTNAIMSYDLVKGAWINREGINLKLSQSEYIYTTAYFEENMLSANDHMEELLVFVYDTQPDVDCLSKVISVYPDGMHTETDIAQLGLKDLVAGIDKPGCDGFLMMDKSSNLKVFDSSASQTLAISHQTILEEYLPYAHADNSVLCEDNRYLFTRDGNRAVVWDLATGRRAFERIFTSFYDLYFSGAHEIVYYNGGDRCVYTCDLETGLETKILDKSYFEDNSAFLNVPYNFVYSDEYDVCFFLSSTGCEEDSQVSTDVLTMTDLEGNILAKSAELEVYNGDHYGTIHIVDGLILMDLSAVDTSVPVEDDIYTYFFRALFTTDDEGNIDFADSAT